MFSYAANSHTSKQSWLGTVALCPCCKSQQPKDGFKHVNGEEMCTKCQAEDFKMAA